MKIVLSLKMAFALGWYKYLCVRQAFKLDASTYYKETYGRRRTRDLRPPAGIPIRLSSYYLIITALT